MADRRVSIGQVKRDISELVNRVAYGGERILLTSRGKPKAVLVNLDDYARLQEERGATRAERWADWVARSQALSTEILTRRDGQPVDVDAIWQAAQAEHEARDAQTVGG